MKLNVALVSGTLAMAMAESRVGRAAARDAGCRAGPAPRAARSPPQFLHGDTQRCPCMDHLSVLRRQM